MKQALTNLIIYVGALLLCPTHSRADSYTLSYSLVIPSHGNPKGSKAPKRPLVVDLVGHTLTLPSQVISLTLIYENEEGNIYTSLIEDSVVIIPPEFHGKYHICITDGVEQYSGIFEI